MSQIDFHRIHILLVEDSPSDAKLTLAALKMGKIINRVTHVVDGVQAMEYLRGENGYTDAPRPDLVLLDLNLPKKSGLEVLAEMKKDASLLSIPVIVLTTSQAETDIATSYKQHANCFITKPFGFDEFLEVVKSIEHFWLSVVTLPSNP